MAKCVFKGVATALITPFAEDGSVNYDKLAELTHTQIEQGINALVPCGTTGEKSTLRHEEHVRVIETVVKAAAGRVPVIAGTGSNDTLYSVELSQAAVAVGADALLTVTPYYNKTSQSGLIEHFTYIADRVTKPLILYNIPSRTGMNILPETYAALSRHPMIAGVKEANGDFSAMARTRMLCGEDFAIYAGNDDQTLPVASLGGAGVISVLSNLLPGQMANLTALALGGDFAGALRLQNRLLPLMNALLADVNPIPIKAAMTLAGFAAGRCRMPLAAPSPALTGRLRQEMAALGLAVN